MLRDSSFGRFHAMVVGLVAIAGLALVPRPAAAQDAAGFITRLGNQATQALRLPPAQRTAQFRHIFSSDFDMEGAAQFVMGPHWRQLTPEQQQQQFMPLFRDYLARAYSERLGQYAGEPFRVTGSRQNGGETVVSSQVQRPGKPIEMDWHVVDRGGRFLVSDVYVDGVSMRLTHRQEFASIIQRNGGHPEALLAAMRQQLGQAAPQVGSSRPGAAIQYQPAPVNTSSPEPANQYQPVPAYGR